MSKQIEEVMGLVEEQMEDANGGILSTAQYVKLDSIRAKLRELLPVWQPIETAPIGQTFLVRGGQWNGEVSDPHPSDVAIVSFDGGQFSEVGGDFYSSWIESPTHWMPFPKAPE